MLAVCTFINKNRISKGWGILPASEAELVASVYIEILDKARVPVKHYARLYDRAMETRIRKLSNGETPPDFSAELMVACWVGPNGLSNEMREADSQRLLPETVKSDCPKCFGTGWAVSKMEGSQYNYAERCVHGE